MALVLGKQKQKRHITRFAAEALSFLVRKVPSDSMLAQVTLDILRDLDLNPSPLFIESIATMFKDAICSTHHVFHSKSTAIIRALMGATSTLSSEAGDKVLEGVLIAMVHHGNRDSVSDVFKELVEGGSVEQLSKLRVSLIWTAVRKGTKVNGIDSLQFPRHAS